MLVMQGVLTRMQRALGLAVPVAGPTPMPMQLASAAQVKINSGELVQHIAQALSQSVAQLLKMNVVDIGTDSELSEFGFDSISLTEWTAS